MYGTEGNVEKDMPSAFSNVGSSLLQAIVPAPLGLVEQLSSCVLGGSLAVDS